jgi:uncharacterized protein
VTRPGINVVLVDTPPPRSAPATTDAAFIVGLTEQGPPGPELVTSAAGFARRFGARVPYGALSDAVEAFFREGGTRAYISRVVGPGAVASGLTLMDGAGVPVASLRVTAAGPGDWGDALHVAVATGDDGFTITVTRDGAVVDQSPTLADKAAALDWGSQSRWVDVAVAGAGGNPATLASTALTGGDDDRDAVGTGDWEDALARFSRSLGPGQVLAPGGATAGIWGALLDHANANNRRALLDAPDTAVVGSLEAAATNARGAAPGNARMGALWAPWVRLPGAAGGTTRLVPPSPVLAGLIARSDAVSANPARPAANRNGITRSVSSLTQGFTDEQMETLYAAGVNLLRVTDVGIVAYGDTSLADRDAEPVWSGFAANRVVMAASGRA